MNCVPRFYHITPVWGQEKSAGIHENNSIYILALSAIEYNDELHSRNYHQPQCHRHNENLLSCFLAPGLCAKLSRPFFHIHKRTSYPTPTSLACSQTLLTIHTTCIDLYWLMFLESPNFLVPWNLSINHHRTPRTPALEKWCRQSVNQIPQY